MRQLVRPRQQGQGICGSTRLFESTREKPKHCHDLAWELADIVWILDYRYEDNVNEWTYDELHNDMFDARDVEAQGKMAPM